jgi:predicted cupin superfamily sugar epimerase
VDDLPAWASGLGLEPHPEGGWYRRTWRSDLTLSRGALPADYPGPRAAGTAILYLLTPGQTSAWHVVRSDELWLWHRGGPLTLRLGGDSPSGPAPEQFVKDTRLGAGIESGEQPQVLVPAGHWQSAVPAGDEAVLVSCVVVPGFDVDDFVLARSD